MLFSVLVLGSVVNNALSMEYNSAKARPRILTPTESREKDLIENRNKKSADRELQKEIIRFQQYAALIEEELAALHKGIAQADIALDQAITISLNLNHEQQ